MCFNVIIMNTSRETQFAVSYFASIRSKKTGNITLEEFIAGVRNGRWQLPTENYRLIKARRHEKEATRLKSLLPAITVACICNGGHQSENITALTGLIPIDLDHTDQRTEEVFNMVCRLPYVVAAMISVSGMGVKAMLRVQVERQEDYPFLFDEAARRIAHETGHAVDPSGRNINRLCFVSYHPGAYYHPQATPMVIKELGEAVFQKAVKDVSKKHIYTIGNRNNFIFALMCMLRRRKMDQNEARRWCQRSFELPQEELEVIVKNAYKSEGKQAVEEELKARRENNEEKRKETISQIEGFITNRYQLRYNVVTRQTEMCRTGGSQEFEPITDYEENSVLRELLRDGYKITAQLLHNILNSDLAQPYNPFIDYFDTLPPWDGTDYIARHAATVVTTQPHHWQTCFRKWLVAMAAGWIHPEVVNHTVLVLVGKQGIYKTTWCLSLLPPQLKRYCYSGVVDAHTRDGKFTLAQCGLVNFEEIENLSRKDLNTFKALVTQSVINERDFYGRNKEFMVRRASIIASGNNKEILTDMTGNRRWLCFEAMAIKHLQPHQINYQGIYSQVKAMLDDDFRYWFNYDEMEELDRQNIPFVLQSVEEEQLAVWFRKPAEGETGTYMTASQIMGRLTQWVHAPMNAVSIGRVLKATGYQSRIMHKKVRAYNVVERTPEEVKHQAPDGE